MVIRWDKLAATRHLVNQMLPYTHHCKHSLCLGDATSAKRAGSLGKLLGTKLFGGISRKVPADMTSWRTNEQRDGERQGCMTPRHLTSSFSLKYAILVS